MTQYYPFCGFSDPISSLSHFAGALVCLAASIPLWRCAGEKKSHKAAVAIFSFACVFLLAMSGVYHLLPHESSGRHVLQYLDHAAIFVLIAGTITPVHAILFRGPWRWAPLLVIWMIATVGITLKMIYFSDIPENLGTAIYLLMGWLGIVSMILVWSRWGFGIVQPLIRGAFLYTFGAGFEFLKAPVILPGVLGPHELFHFAVLGGITYHWAFVRRISTLP